MQELSEKTREIDELKAKNQQLEDRLAKLEAKINGSINQPAINSSVGYLDQNIPNPSGGSTIINYHLPANSINARIVITDIKGSVIKSINIINGGDGQININGGTFLSSGSYIYTLYVGGKIVDSKKMIIRR